MKNARCIIKLLAIALLIISYQSCIKEEQNFHHEYSLAAYPNPCDSIVHVYFDANIGENGKIILSDGNKSFVMFDSVLLAGSHDIKIDLTDKKAGMYFLELHTETSVDRIQILKN